MNKKPAPFNRPSPLQRSILSASAASLVAAALTVPQAAAQFISLTGATTYTQNFDLALGTVTAAWVDNTTIPGWHAGINANATADGNLQATNGAAALNGQLNLGTTGAPDRTLGSKATSGGANANIAFGVLFKNDSAFTLDITNISYVGELWRTNDTAAGLAEVWTTFTKISPTVFTDVEPGGNSATANVGSFTSFPALNWSSPTNLPAGSQLDGNLAANRAARSGDPNLLLAPGEFFMFRWVDTNLPGVDGFQGIDDFSIHFAISTIPNNLTYNLNHTVGGAPNGIVQAGAGSGNYWLKSGSPAALTTNDNIFFTQAGSATLSVPANVDLNNITVNAASGTYTFNGAGSMNGALIKSSGSTLVLNNSNNFGSLTISDAGLVIAGAPQNIAGAITSVVNTPTIQTDANVTAGFLNGTELLTKTGSAALILNGAGGNATGGLRIAAGKVSAAVISALGGAGQVITVNGATLEFTGTGGDQIFSDATTGRTLKVGTGGATIAVTAAAPASVNFQLADSLADQSITETGTITKTGVGILRMGAAVAGGINQATFTGNWIVDGGVLEYGTAATNALGTGTVTVNSGGSLNGRNTPVPNRITLAGGNLGTRSGDLTDFQGTVNVASASTVTLRSYTTVANAQSITISGLLSGTANLTVNGNLTNSPTTPKALILTNTDNTYSGNFHVTAAQALASAPVAPDTGSAFGLGSVVHLEGGALGVRDEGAGNDGTIGYGTDIRVESGTNAISVDHALVGGVNTGNTVAFGPLTIGAQTLNIAGANGYKVAFASATLSGAVGTSATINPDASGPTTITGAITGVAGLTKGGTGTLTLSGAAGYTGPTSIDDGTLILTGTLAGTPRIDIKSAGVLDVSGAASFTVGAGQTLAGTGSVVGSTIVANGGVIEGGDPAGLGTLTVGPLTLGTAAGNTATIRTSANNSGGSVVVGGTNTLVANGGALSVTVNVFGAQPTVGNHILIDYDGAIGGTGFAAFKLGSLPPRTSATLFNSAGNFIGLNVSSIDFPIWSGRQSSEWSTNAISPPKNWVLNSNNASGTDFIVNDRVLFNDFATTTVVDVSNGNVFPQEVVFDNKTKAYTLQGSNGIAGPIGITKNGDSSATSLLTINNDNIFTGPVTMNAGTVRVATVAASGIASPLGAGTNLAFDGGTLEFTGAVGTTNRGITTQTNGATVKNGAGSALTLSGVIDGIGGFTKSGNGTVILTALSTYTGITTLAGGILNVGSAENAGVSGPLGNFGTIVFGGGTLQHSAANVNDYSGRFSTDPGQAYSVDTNGQTVTWATDLTSSGGTLTKLGAGTLILGGPANNTYGDTTVTGGTLIAGKAAGVTAIPGNLVVATGATFSYLTNNVSDQIADTASVIIDGGTFGDPANVGPTNPGATDKILNLTISNGGRFGSGRNTALATPTFEITDTLTVTGGFALAQRGGAITAGTVVVAGPGAVNLDGGSTTAGQQSRLNVGLGGLTLAGASVNLNAGPSAVGATSVGSVLTLNGNVTSAGTSSIARLSPTLSTAIVDLAAAVRTFDVTGTLTIAPDLGAATDLATGGVHKTGAGKLVLAGAQNYASLINDAGRTDVLKTLGTGTSAVTANAGTINFADNQTLASLVIANGAEVTIGAPLPPAPAEAFALGGGANGAAAVPEPGSAALLMGGLTMLLGLRKRRQASSR